MQYKHLNNLAWNKGKEGWTTLWTLANGKTTKIIIDILATDESIPEAAWKSLQLFITNEPAITYKIVAAMIELYADWNDGETITPEELIQRITLTDVIIWEEGDGQLYYDPDGDMFTDHVINAYFDANGQIDEPDLAG